MPDAKLYFGEREVKEFGDSGESGLVWVVFNDGTREVMRAEEWALKSEAPKTEDHSFDMARVQAVSTEILKLLKKHNIRLEDLRAVFTAVVDPLQLAVNQAKELALGAQPQYLRVDDIQKVLDDARNAGANPPLTQIIRKVQGNIVEL